MNDYTSREIFKISFDEIITQKRWKEMIQEIWDSKNWIMLKFLIEQRIGKSSPIEQEDNMRDIRIILGDIEATKP